MADPYSTLGIAKGASDKDIKSAYRKLAKELHPDRNKGNEAASERFSTVTRAYDLLSDKDKRAAYDRGEIDGEGNPAMPFGFGGGGGAQYRAAPGGAGGFEFGNGGADFGDIFEGLFGGAGRSGGFGARRPGPPPPPQKGANVAYRLRVPFVDAASLAKQRITLEDGKSIDLSLPKGVDNGTQMKLGGKGRSGPGGAGDAIVTIEVQPHAFFRRDGDDVLLDLPITVREAALGAKVKVPTVEGPVMLSIPAGSSSGKVLRLKERGFHGKTGGRGSQCVTLMIALPRDADALQKLADAVPSEENPRSDLGV
ncbi:MAG: J domain-containing protein [Parasphingorhabdus sp.]|nr:J domain-containing protein [Parasphingorhabdus sp.]